MIGVLGGLRFRVSDNRVFTFKNLKREVSASWNTVERIGMKPLTEFGGAKLQTLTLEIILDASLGVRPREMLETITQMVETGERDDLIIGKKMLGENEWVITKCSETWGVVLRKGELYRATVSLSLQEYV